MGYLGEQGQHIEDYGNVNQWLVNGDPTSAPYYNNQYIGVNAIDPSVSIGSESVADHRVARRDELQRRCRRCCAQRLNHGLEFTVNYTYGKALTNSLGNYALNVSGFSGAFQNYYNSAADWGPAGYDVRHNRQRDTASYALPIGRGSRIFSGVNRVVDEAIGGWRFSTASSATPASRRRITGPGNNSNSYGNSRPNQYRKLKIVHRTHRQLVRHRSFGNAVHTLREWTTACAPSARRLRTPSAPRATATLRGPGYFNTDMSAFKDFHIVREQTVGFRFDAFNAFNIVSYGNPDTGITDSNFGNISNQGARSSERHLQFSANYRF